MISGLNDDITYWAPGTENPFGGMSYSPPKALKGRWEDTQEAVINAAGQQVTSKARIFLDEPVQSDGFIYLGTTTETDPRSVRGAEEVGVVGSIPDIASLERLYTVYVIK